MEYTYKDEDSIDITLLCRICRLPFIDPVFHLDCGNTFCKKCLHNLKDCPSSLCRKPLTNTIPSPKIIIDLLDRLKVICPSCKEVYDRGVLLDHINNCPTLCILGCDEMVSPRERESHQKGCSHQEVECLAFDVGCNWKGKRKDIENHHRICQWILMRTPLLEVIKWKKDQGNENEKLRKEIVQLKGENEKLNKEMALLKDENQSLRNDFSELKESNNMMKKEMNELKQQISTLSKQNEGTLTTNPNSVEKSKQLVELKIEKQWNFVAPMQSERYKHSSAVDGDFIYSIGGKKDVITKLASVERYNIKSNQWESFPSLKSARSDHSSVTYGDSIFCIGGYLSDRSITNTVEKYDVKKSKEWYSVAPMITARSELGAAVYREFIFVTGGYADPTVPTVEKYNTQTNKWSAVSSMISKRRGHVSITCGDSIYSIGGGDGGKQWLNSAERYDIQTDKWISIAPTKQQRGWYGAVSIGESIFVLGGRVGSSPLKSVEIYDIRSNQWMEITPLNTARWGLTAAICGNSIFAIGGSEDGTSDRLSKTVEKLQLL